ncbi:secreted protein [Lasius niger]|uniref:Secreted protein n=1 Tax=Lasius niger TaxID=67767 RepID=A0A0J7KG44_LASNI|nr:secreted protein [Lasius niger]
MKAKAAADAVVIKRGGALADYGALGDRIYAALDDDADVDAPADERIAMTTDPAAIPVGKIVADAAAIRRGKAPADHLDALGDKISAGTKIQTRFAEVIYRFL